MNRFRLHCGLFFSLAFVCSAQSSQKPTRDVYLNPKEKTDLGAAITAADKKLGKNCGRIIVPSRIGNAFVTSTPELSECRVLELRSPITWNTPLTIRSNNTVLGIGVQAVQTLPAGVWIDSRNLAHVEIADLTVRNTHRESGLANQMFSCRTCSHISVHDVHAQGTSIFASGSIAENYEGVREDNLSHDIDVSNNELDGEGTPSSVFIFYYTQHARADRNRSRNAQFIGFWAGGDAAVEGRNPVSPRWAADIKISNSSGHNLQSFVWGSMGHDITVSNITGDVCSDVGLDAEGSDRVTFSSFSLTDCKNGNIATFFQSRDIDFGPGRSTCTRVTNPDGKPLCELARFKNDSKNSVLAQRIHVHDVTFRSIDPSMFAPIYYDPIGNLEFVRNSAADAVFAPSAGAMSGFKFQHNTLIVTHVLSQEALPSTIRLEHPASVTVSIDGAVLKDSWIEDNTFRSSVLQPTECYAIYVRNADYNSNDTVYLTNNTTVGFRHDVRVEAASSNPGITPTFRFKQNNFGGHFVQMERLGRNGSFLEDSVNNRLKIVH